MSTFMANKGNIERKWYVIDAAGKPMGKTAVAAADLLRGKRKVTYTPHADCGDNVIVINAGKATVTIGGTATPIEKAGLLTNDFLLLRELELKKGEKAVVEME